MVRKVYGRICMGLLRKRTAEPTGCSINQSAIIFSPHFDDETLGVGGTIIKKRRSGAEIHLVFMTDGSRSHRAMDGKTLSNMRKAEALEAAEALGVQATNVTFLDFPEQRLAEHQADATNKVAELLATFRYEQVFVPSKLEPVVWSSDHLATTGIVLDALGRVGQRPEILEYLVWFWYHWPWVPFWRGCDARQILKLSLEYRFGLSTLKGLNTAVPIADVTSQKRAALDKYKSQMTRLSTDKPWPILSDVAEGEFLTCFFQPTEFFKRYQFLGESVC